MIDLAVVAFGVVIGFVTGHLAGALVVRWMRADRAADLDRARRGG